MQKFINMSAPISARLPGKDVVNLLTRANICFVLTIIAFVLFTLNSSSFLDLIHNCLFVSEVIITYISFFNIVLNNFVLSRCKSSQKPSTVKARNLLKSLGCLVTGTVFYHTVAVLYGAPFLESATETFHFAMLLTVTTVLPALCVLGLNLSSWVRVFGHSSPDPGAESVLFCSTVGSIVGAWLGAFPIPLDWDRPWQVWPITCILGNLFGYITGLGIGCGHLYVLYQKSRKFKIT